MYETKLAEQTARQTLLRRPYAALNSHVKVYQGHCDTATDQEDFIIDTEAAITDFGDTIMRLALCRLGNRSDAEDVVQEVFLKLCQRETPFESNEHLKAWLLRVALNCAADVRRDPFKQRQVAMDALENAMSGVVGVERSAQAANMARSHTAGDLLEIVPKAVASLPEKQRVVVHLFYYEQYSVKDIASITNEKSSTVRSHLHRARKALKTIIGKSTSQRFVEGGKSHE